MDDTKIAPALTAEEWGYIKRGAVAFQTPALGRHATAAASLYGQPFGFTREDVALLRGVESGDTTFSSEGVADLESLADRIEALLPPAPLSAEQIAEVHEHLEQKHNLPHGDLGRF